MTSRVIVYVFAGRRPNMELQSAFMRRVLDENPGVEYHVWDMAYDAADSEYLATLAGDRIRVRTDFVGTPPGHGRWNLVYKYYAANPEYEDSIFIKLDDDIVFLQTHRFGRFVNAIRKYSGHLLIANTFNNGACCPLEPALWKQFETLNIPLLDIHKSNEFAELAHNYFFTNYRAILDQPVELVPTEDWASINAIGYDWPTAQLIAERVGSIPHPPFIAGRRFPLPWGLGDEGMGNLLPRIIVKGFAAAHLTFGPQHCTDEQTTRWRRQYAEIWRRYTDRYEVDNNPNLPELSETSWAYRGEQPEFDAALIARWGPDNWRVRALAGSDPRARALAAGENDPCAGRQTPLRIP